MPTHFGVEVLERKYGLKLTRENYAIINKKSSFPFRFSLDIYANKDSREYSDEWCDRQLEDCLNNYDLTMEFFSLLNHNEFNKAINNFLNNNKTFSKGFVEVYDLNLYDEKPGYYIMVLEEYCQIYVGTTCNIKKRIREHWRNRKPFDRLLFPMGAVDSSILSIDSFRAFDTTRIFAYTTNRTYSIENNIINIFPAEFLCNRMAGGKITGGLLQAITMMKNRNLIK